MRAANDNRRLLTKSQAAVYVGVSVPSFDAVCPVKPISLGEGARMRRYDVQQIDAWIDRLHGNEGGEMSLADKLLEVM